MSILPGNNNNDRPLMLSTAYLPGLDHMAAASVCASLQVEHHETFPKQTWRNRCRLLTANGVLDLIVPVVRPRGRHSQTGEVRISTHLPWQKQHWRTMASAYANAPYFMFYADLIQQHYFRPPPMLLASWNHGLFMDISRELGFGYQVDQSQDFIRPVGADRDLRYSFSPKAHKNTLSGAFHWPAYPQVFSPPTGFVPNLSVVDLLFNTGPDAGPYLQECGKELLSQFSAG
jgi:hypothetical protein